MRWWMWVLVGAVTGWVGLLVLVIWWLGTEDRTY